VCGEPVQLESCTVVVYRIANYNYTRIGSAWSVPLQQSNAVTGAQ
jgi:hypothetical protein